jgi:chitinase
LPVLVNPQAWKTAVSLILLVADLAHYEIQDILSKNKKRDLVPVYDKAAAVKYLAWDNDQWISYDDAETFKQKVEWADSVGFSGSLIWASDLGE